MYRNDITVEQRQYLLQAIEFVRLAARRARERAALRTEMFTLGMLPLAEDDDYAYSQAA